MSIIFLTSCSESNPENFIGESDNWKITYGRDEKLIVNYIGEGPISKKRNIHLSIFDERRPDTRTFHLSDRGLFKMKIAFNEAPNDMKFTIEWDGLSESLNLKEL